MTIRLLTKESRMSRRFIRRLHDPVPPDSHRHLCGSSVARWNLERDKLLGRRFLGLFLQCDSCRKIISPEQSRTLHQTRLAFQCRQDPHPLLLLHGTEDTNVPIGESIQIFNALRLLGRDVEFITVDGQNHVITDFDKKLIWQDTIMAWFAKYLKETPDGGTSSTENEYEKIIYTVGLLSPSLCYMDVLTAKRPVIMPPR